MEKIEQKRRLKEEKEKRLFQGKTKRKKKISTQVSVNENNLSIEYIHDEKLKYFQELQEIILPEKLLLLDTFKAIKNQNPLTISILERQISNEIQDIKSRKEEIEYYYLTLGLLKEYCELKTLTEKRVFGKASTVDKKLVDVMDKYKTVTKTSSLIKKELMDNFCPFCTETETELIEEEGFVVCYLCGYTLKEKIISSRVPYKDRNSYETVNKMDYKRLNYFKDALLQIQGNEYKNIPQVVIDEVTVELDKENIKDPKNVTINKIRSILNNLGRPNFYENIPKIIKIITGKPLVILPLEVDTKVIFMFNCIEAEYIKHNFRDHFFSYPYIAHKIFEILDLHEFCKYFSYLQDREKLHYQDTMLEAVINELLKQEQQKFIEAGIEWKFIRST